MAESIIGKYFEKSVKTANKKEAGLEYQDISSLADRVLNAVDQSLTEISDYEYRNDIDLSSIRQEFEQVKRTVSTIKDTLYKSI